MQKHKIKYKKLLKKEYKKYIITLINSKEKVKDMSRNSYYKGDTTIRETIKEYFGILTIKDKIIVGVLAVILVLVFILVQKLVSLSIIVGKTKQYEKLPNAYQEINNDVSDNIKKYQIYKKDDKVKSVSISRRNAKVTKYYSNNEVKTYTDSGSNKTSSISSGITNDDKITVNFLGNTALADMITDVFVVKLTSENVEGIDCHVLSGIKSNNAYYVQEDVENIKLYIQKSTNLPMKIVEELKNGKIRVTTYKYEFNVVTEKDIREPGRVGYNR